MSDLNLVFIKDELEKKTTAQLIDVLSFVQDDYKPEVIPIIEKILTERGIDQNSIDGYKISYDKLKKKINESKFIPSYKTPLIVTIIILAIVTFVWRTSTTNYFKSSKTTTPLQGWTSDYTDSVKDALINSPGFKTIPKKYQNAFCDCYLKKLKALYPNRIKITINGDIVDTLVSQCADTVKRNIK